MAKHKSKPNVRVHRGNHVEVHKLIAVHPGPLGWHLYLLSAPHSGSAQWYNLKLVAATKAPRKANWWFGYNVTEDRFGPQRDATRLKKLAPGIHAWVVAVVGRHDAEDGWDFREAEERGERLARQLGCENDSLDVAYQDEMRRPRTAPDLEALL